MPPVGLESVFSKKGSWLPSDTMANSGANCFVADAALLSHQGPFPRTERGVPTSVYLHPKEPKIIYGSGNLVIVKSLENPAECFVYRGHNAPVTVAKFSPSGFWVASADDTGKVRVWSWDNPEVCSSLPTSASSDLLIPSPRAGAAHPEDRGPRLCRENHRPGLGPRIEAHRGRRRRENHQRKMLHVGYGEFSRGNER